MRFFQAFWEQHLQWMPATDFVKEDSNYERDCKGRFYPDEAFKGSS